ncbi:ABC transporter substrate-binding protein [Brucella pseudogrignonensis]|uniref:Branched-chain amino acid transport system substrate-binding protein n=1 Tax=Brucella pseudogrignonensis TaxID=419475 RepID=A0ABU1MBD5_9HYPH|nr:ABC transporter substrate-binding protein [Brucella pseudogrignonensis]MDR6433339.1 branched-chain amino acid transport system substrate-binding protein [Brucella pseudogrignonensis]
MLLSDRDQLVFHIIAEAGQWYRVLILREAQLGSHQFASVQLRMIRPSHELTIRELDVLTLLAGGLSNENISARLTISTRTVAKHVENLFHKTKLWSRSALAGFAVDNGLLRLPTPGGYDGYPLATGQIEEIADMRKRHRLRKEVSKNQCTARQNGLRPLYIGMPYAAQGWGVADAKEMLNGAELAIAELNARGGVLGRNIELHAVAYEGGNKNSILAAYHQLIEHEVDAITSGYACYSPEVHDMIGETGIPYLHAATMDQAVKRVKYDRTRLGNIFQTCASDINYGVGLTRFIEQMQAMKHWCTKQRRLAVVKPSWSNLDLGIEQVEAELHLRGWQIDVIEVPTASADCWQNAVASLARTDPSIIVLASFFVEDAIAFQRAFMQQPLHAMIYAIYAPSVPQFCAELGDLSEGIVWATTSGLYTDAIGEGFRKRYQHRFSTLPGQSQAGLAYDRVTLLSGAWLRTGQPRKFRDVVSDLRTSINRGVNGSYFLGTDGQMGLAYPDDTSDLSISQAHLVFQIQKGRHTVIGPAPYTQSSLQTPPWC